MIDIFKSKEKTNHNFESLWFYRYLNVNNKKTLFSRALLLLYIPFLCIVFYCFVARYQSIPYIDPYFLGSGIIASLWFIWGPILIYKFIDHFIALSTSPELNRSTRSYFTSKKAAHYQTFKRNTVRFTFIFCIIVIGALLKWPDIITDHISHGYHDGMYWILVFMISYFLCYCSTAMSAIILTIKAVWELCKFNIVDYTPNRYDSYSTVKHLIGFINKIIAYFCSGMLFLPFAWYFLLYRDATIYHIWTIILLILYGVFLLMSIAIPRTILLFYQKDNIKKYLMHCKEYYANIQTSLQVKLLGLSKHSRISDELRQYNTYCYIKAIEDYYSVKTKYYEEIANKGVLDYLFNK